MAEECFDLAVEGTTLKDIRLFNTSKSVIVVDKAQNYGTTYIKMKDLKDSPYISNFEVKFESESIKGSDFTFVVESLPFFLSPTDNSVKLFSEKVMGDFIEYAKVENIFFISESLVKIPTSKNDILKLEISRNDKFYLNQALAKADLSSLREHFSDKTNPIYRALVDLAVFSDQDLRKISLNFGFSAFIYPVYGISEISESACFRNSFRGTTYVLNKTLEYSEMCEDDEFRHLFTCELGTIRAKEYERQSLKPGKFYIRAILSSKIKFNGIFLAFIELNKDELALDFENPDSQDDKFVKVIGLDSSAHVCDKGLQVMYFIKRHSKIEDHELKKLLIFESDILIDLSFITKYDIDQFS